MVKTITSLTIAAAAVAAAFTAQPVQAQNAPGSVCAQRDAIIKRLESKYGETRQAVGLQRNNGVVEIFASADTGSWTIVVTMPTGMSCLMAAGESFERQDTESAGLADEKA